MPATRVQPPRAAKTFRFSPYTLGRDLRARIVHTGPATPATPATPAPAPRPKAPRALIAYSRQPQKMAPKRKADEPEAATRTSKRQSTAATKAAVETPKVAPVKKAAPAKKAAATAAAKKAAPKAAPKKTAAPAAKKATPAPKPAAKPAAKKPVAKKVAPKAAIEKPAAPKKITAAAAKKAAAAQAAAGRADAAAPAPTVEAAPPKPHKFGPTINEAPTQRLNIYVFGEGSQGELGLGHLSVNGKEPTDVTRPRLNALLDAAKVGVVKAAAGGMHSAALTFDNKILTWGVNDQGALGRDTADTRTEEEKDDEEDLGLNPSESAPGQVSPHWFPEGTIFTDLCCSDSATFVVSHDGAVYGWGTFRAAEGVLGFSERHLIEYKPVLVPELKKIVSITCGANHVLATDIKGNVFAWGCGQQNQLGRRVVERTRTGGLVPREFGLPRGQVAFTDAGEFHSFAIDSKNQVWSWGLNNYAQTGIQEAVGESNAVIPHPTIVKTLKDHKIVQLAGGNHHTIALTAKGEVLAWGRCDSHALGVDVSTIPRELVVYESGLARLVKEPVVIPGITASFIASGTDNSFAVTTDGKVYSWGFSENSQTGQGPVSIVKTATLIDNTAIRGKKITWAAGGGQFSMLAGPADI